MSAKKFEARHAVSSLVVVAALGMGAASALADAPPGQYTVTAGTVLDTKTGLVWQQAVPPALYTWADAKTYCTNNVAMLPGSGWRMPSVSELQSIVDDSRSYPAIDLTFFPSTPPNAFWTSSPYPPSAGNAWYVYFANGIASYDLEITPNPVRCVR